jgi:hypothetical protein
MPCLFGMGSYQAFRNRFQAAQEGTWIGLCGGPGLLVAESLQSASIPPCLRTTANRRREPTPGLTVCVEEPTLPWPDRISKPANGTGRRITARAEACCGRPVGAFDCVGIKLGLTRVAEGDSSKKHEHCSQPN